MAAVFCNPSRAGSYLVERNRKPCQLYSAAENHLDPAGVPAELQGLKEVGKSGTSAPTLLRICRQKSAARPGVVSLSQDIQGFLNILSARLGD